MGNSSKDGVGIVLVTREALNNIGSFFFTDGALRYRDLLWTSLLVDRLMKNEGADLQAAYVGRLDQSEAEKEAGPVG